MTKQKYLFFQYLSGASLLLDSVQQKGASRATAHLAIKLLTRCSCKLLKVFTNRFYLCNTGQF